MSIVICAQNELENLKTLLPKLYDQSHSNFEIIVVNDRSNDGSYDYLLEESQRELKLKVVTISKVPDKFNGKKYAITLGVKAAQFDKILLTDADCIPMSNEWANNMSSFKGDFNLGFSSYKKTSGLLNYFIRFETLWTGINYIGLALAGVPYMGVGRNLAYRKSLFFDNKGFSGYMDVTGGDDDLLVNKHATAKNTAITIGNESLTESIPKTTWPTFFRQKLRHLSVGKYYRPKTRVLLGILTISHTFMWLLLFLLIAAEYQWPIVAGLFIAKTILTYLTFILGSKRFGVRFNIWGLIFLDLMYVLYFLITGIAALMTKRVRWT